MNGLLDRTIAASDRIILALFPKEELDKRDIEFKNEDTGDPVVRAIYEASDSIDTKATAVLQHVSIMIAVAGVLFGRAKIGVFKWLFAIETIFYVILALACLRLLMHQHLKPAGSDTLNVVAKEAVFELTAKLTFFVSVLLIISVLVELAVE